MNILLSAKKIHRALQGRHINWAPAPKNTVLYLNQDLSDAALSFHAHRGNTVLPGHLSPVAPSPVYAGNTPPPPPFKVVA